MLTEICSYLKNYFDFNMPKYYGNFEIIEGSLTPDVGILPGQYYRIIGSVFNDGVWKYGEDTLTDESFNGSVWLMAVPPDLIGIMSDISDWQAKYGSVDSENMSPYSSESFGGYSYSKGPGGSGDGNGTFANSWQSVFASRLRRWKKL